MTYLDLLEAIAGVIVRLWPERPLYRDFCPADFARPSGFLYVREAGYRDGNLALVEWSVEAELTLYAATDAYTLESTEALRADQAAVLAAFGLPVQVGDRMVRVGAQADTPGPGEAYVVFTASWTDIRPGYRDPEDPASGGGAPVMEDFALHVDVSAAAERKE